MCFEFHFFCLLILRCFFLASESSINSEDEEEPGVDVPLMMEEAVDAHEDEEDAAAEKGLNTSNV